MAISAFNWGFHAFEPPEDFATEQQLRDLAADCAHLALRPKAESDGYLCSDCHHELGELEAEEASSEVAVRAIHPPDIIL